MLSAYSSIGEFIDDLNYVFNVTSNPLPDDCMLIADYNMQNAGKYNNSSIFNIECPSGDLLNNSGGAQNAYLLNAIFNYLHFATSELSDAYLKQIQAKPGQFQLLTKGIGTKLKVLKNLLQSKSSSRSTPLSSIDEISKNYTDSDENFEQILKANTKQDSLSTLKKFNSINTKDGSTGYSSNNTSAEITKLFNSIEFLISSHDSFVKEQKEQLKLLNELGVISANEYKTKKNNIEILPLAPFRENSYQVFTILCCEYRPKKIEVTGGIPYLSIFAAVGDHTTFIFDNHGSVYKTQHLKRLCIKYPQLVTFCYNAFVLLEKRLLSTLLIENNKYSIKDERLKKLSGLSDVEILDNLSTDTIDYTISEEEQRSQDRRANVRRNDSRLVAKKPTDNKTENDN